MHKRAQRPRSAIDGPQRTRRTALDEQYEYLANQLTKQRMLDREGGSHLDDLADIHEFILRAEHAGRDAMANAIARRQVLTDVHGAQIETTPWAWRTITEPPCTSGSFTSFTSEMYSSMSALSATSACASPSVFPISCVISRASASEPDSAIRRIASRTSSARSASSSAAQLG